MVCLLRQNLQQPLYSFVENNVSCQRTQTGLVEPNKRGKWKGGGGGGGRVSYKSQNTVRWPSPSALMSKIEQQ